MRQNFVDEIPIKDITGDFVVLKGDKIISPRRAGAPAKENLGETAEKIINKAGVKFTDAALQGRLKNVILSYLNNVRDRLESEEVLKKSINKGGLELDRQTAAKIINLSETFLKRAGAVKGLTEEKAKEPKEGPETVIPQDKKLAADIVKKSGFSLSEDLRTRLETAILTYIRDIRDKFEFQDLLEKSVEEGGLGFESADVEKLLKLIEEKKEVEEPMVKPAPEPEEKAIPPSPPSPPAEKLVPSEVKRVAPPPPVPPVKKIIPPLPPKVEKAPSPPAPSPAKKAAPPPPKIEKVSPLPPPPKFVPSEREGVEGIEISPPKPPMSAKPTVTRRPPEATGKRPRIEDIKFKPKLVGPIEELRGLTLDDFRKLSPDPSRAAEKIQDKINLLEEESFVKKMAGIKAWRESPLYRLYTKIGVLSLSQGKPVTNIIEERQRQNEPALTEEEFNKIMDLNKRLRM